jgi:hypothetical protein
MRLVPREEFDELKEKHNLTLLTPIYQGEIPGVGDGACEAIVRDWLTCLRTKEISSFRGLMKNRQAAADHYLPRQGRLRDMRSNIPSAEALKMLNWSVLEKRRYALVDTHTLPTRPPSDMRRSFKTTFNKLDDTNGFDNLARYLGNDFYSFIVLEPPPPPPPRDGNLGVLPVSSCHGLGAVSGLNDSYSGFDGIHIFIDPNSYEVGVPKKRLGDFLRDYFEYAELREDFAKLRIRSVPLACEEKYPSTDTTRRWGQ